MIIGIGTDLLEIERMEKALCGAHFAEKTFTDEERRQSGGRASFLAGCFAVREAVVKCFGTGFRDGIGMQDIEVLRDPLGKPYVRLYGAAEEKFHALNGTAIHVSVSNTKTLVSAFAVLEGKE